MECLHCFLGFLLLTARLPLAATRRFHDVLSNERTSDFMREHSQLTGWSSDENEWNEKLYPVWKKEDPRWKNSWKGGHVQAILTSDSPALVGSTITFVVDLVFPRCQKEDVNGNIVYEKNCRNDTELSPDLYVYNWTEEGSWGNGPSQHHHHVFPDGKPFPHHSEWKRCSFVYVFHTLAPCKTPLSPTTSNRTASAVQGQYLQKLGRGSARVSINTANVTLGPQLMEVIVYRRHRHVYVPVAKVKDVYVVTDHVPVFVTMYQKNDRNLSDETFLRDLPIMFSVLIHDPSHFLNESAIYYKWNFGDNTGLFVSNNPTWNHTYVLNGTFSLNLTVQAAVPGPCPSPSPKPPKPTTPLSTLLKSYYSNSPASAGDRPLELRATPEETCHINRYGYFKATITIVDGILKVNIIQMTSVVTPTPQPDKSLVDFVVTCQGIMPTEVCTIVSDPTCQITYETVCDPVDGDPDDVCLLTVRRAFSGSGTYCMNLTLSDNTSLALTSTLVSVSARDSASPSRMANGALVSVGCLAIFVTVITLLVYKKHKEYKLVGNSTGIVVKGKGLNAVLNHAKAMFCPGNQEKDPLLKQQPGTV